LLLSGFYSPIFKSGAPQQEGSASMQYPKKHYLAHIPTIALLCLLAIFPQVAVVLFILRILDRKAERREQEDAYREKYASPRPGVYRSAAAQQPSANNTPNAEDPDALDHPTEEQKNAKKFHEALIALCTALGALFLVTGAANLVDGLDMVRWLGLDFGMFWDYLLPGLLQIAGGGGALLAGLRMHRNRKLEQKLDKVVGQKDNIALAELFAAAGVPAKEGRAVLNAAIDHGYFGADAYIDARTGTLVVRGEAPAPSAPAPQPAAEAAAQPQQTAETEFDRLLRQLREANDSIADPAMTAKITRLEQVAARIFEQAEANPAKKPQLKKFTEYYLPTALRLLHTYAQLDRQKVAGQNILEAKRGIENSMDLLTTAFENQLDKLFQADALETAADIAALQGMLNMDGLTEDSMLNAPSPVQ
jgi:hypothetical protein